MEPEPAPTTAAIMDELQVISARLWVLINHVGSQGHTNAVVALEGATWDISDAIEMLDAVEREKS